MPRIRPYKIREKKGTRKEMWQQKEAITNNGNDRADKKEADNTHDVDVRKESIKNKRKEVAFRE